MTTTSAAVRRRRAASDENPTDEVAGAAPSAEDLHTLVSTAVAQGNVIILPYGMLPAAPIADDASAPIDLGDFNPKLTGMKVVVNRDISLGVSRVVDRMSDPAVSMMEKLALAQQFLEETLLGWNLTTRNPATGEIVPLPQPSEGGVSKLRASMLGPLVEAINKAVAPDPN